MLYFIFGLFLGCLLGLFLSRYYVNLVSKNNSDFEKHRRKDFMDYEDNGSVDPQKPVDEQALDKELADNVVLPPEEENDDKE